MIGRNGSIVVGDGSFVVGDVIRIVFDCNLVLIVKKNVFSMIIYYIHTYSLNLGKKYINSRHELLEHWLYFFWPDQYHVRIRPFVLPFFGSDVLTT